MRFDFIPREHVGDVVALGASGLVGAALLAAEPLMPDLANHPSSVPLTGGALTLVYLVIKVVERTWFRRNDHKTDAVGSSVKELLKEIRDDRDENRRKRNEDQREAEEFRREMRQKFHELEHQYDELKEEVRGYKGFHEELSRQATLYGGMRAAMEKMKKDIQELHELRKSLGVQPASRVKETPP